MANNSVADDVESVEAPERELTLRETIEAARDEAIARQEKQNGGSDATANEPADLGANEARAGSRSGDRDASGRFVKGSGDKGNSAEDSRSNPHGDRQDNRPDNAGSVQQAQPSVAPRSWSAEEKALWAKVPPEAQAVINRRESDYHKQIAQQGQVAALGNEFLQVANEFAPVVQSRGGNPVAQFRDYLRIMSALNSAPDVQSRAAIFQQVAAQQGIDLRVLGIQPQQQAHNPANQQLPPTQNVQALIEQGINSRWQAWQAQLAKEQEQKAMQQTNTEIEAFRSKADAQGNPLYPHFDTVTSLMASLITSGAAQSLEEAYPLAVRAHPETSKLLAAQEQAAKQAQEEQQRKALKAKRAAGSVRGSVGSVAPNGAGDRSLRDELRAAFAEARSRV